MNAVFNVAELRSHFPILHEDVAGNALVYLDNAATMQAPEPVLRAFDDFYRESNSNVHRGVHHLSKRATALYENARTKIADHLGAKAEEVILTFGTTDSLNRLACMLSPLLGEGDEVLVTCLEHNSNILPWRHACEMVGARLVICPIDGEARLDLEAFRRLVGKRTKIVAVTHVSNVSGIPLPVRMICDYCHSHSPALCVVDGAQGVFHDPACMDDLDCDAYAFSGHKIGGPAGTGVLYVRGELLSKLHPATFGGGTVFSVTEDGQSLYDTIERFEPGTPNYPGFVGLAAAIDFWKGYPQSELLAHERDLLARLSEGVADIPLVREIAEKSPHKGTIALAVEKGSAFDWGNLLDARGIAVRTGMHCAHLYASALGFKGTVRISVAPYNTFEEIDACLEALEAASSAIRRWTANK